LELAIERYSTWRLDGLDHILGSEVRLFSL